ncbi:SGNH/GDSL hydrolase family protein [Rhizobium sp. YIM 134829]|uniref:SGNH/GDSL hydrolase family protein n=1 Tax=Rhizobium sp. YIM 134829 TaxID=3390453 RepID=UPI003979833E
MPNIPTVPDETIDREISLRVARHKLGILELQNASSRDFNSTDNRLDAKLGLKVAHPLCLLALGDSWFDYPLLNNGPVLQDTDIIAQLKHYGSPPARILNLAHYGDASTDAMSAQKQRRLIAALADSGNWLGGKPDAILFSAGGNDVAGDQFRTFLNQNEDGTKPINGSEFRKTLKTVEQSYRTLFDLRDRFAEGVPIFAHTYGFAIPNGVHPRCAGPWLQPSLTERGWTAPEQAAEIVREMLKLFQDMLNDLQHERSNNFHVIRSHQLIEPEDWANELHPKYLGFRKVVRQFDSVLRALNLQS